ncbi:DUF2274 domain-containing protein [Mesorhizobium sp. M1340]|uniref:DUF2274 domain-containing protein n=1 Tax=unclassified Mesorhizobium TaxID=325217 RepID=UPI00333DBB5F
MAYAELLGRETGGIMADPAKPISPMLFWFMTAKRKLARARRRLGLLFDPFRSNGGHDGY